MIGLKKKKAEMKEKVNTEEKGSTGKLYFQKEIHELDNIQEQVPQAKLIKSSNKNDFMNFKVEYTPEKESMWYGGKYIFSFSVPDSYPFNAPKVLCETKIYHPNIDFQGNVCLNILKEDWKPTMNITSCITGVYFLFTDPNPNDPLNHEAANVMRESLDSFKQNVKKSLRGGYCFGQQFPSFSRY
jgi:ubiquitin-conjugating enzyme E2 M